MDLILQQPKLDYIAVARLTVLSGARQSIQVGPQAVRCVDVWHTPSVRAAVGRIALDEGLDACFVPSGQRLEDFRVLAMDMDSTLITIECIDEIADMHGLKPQVAAITETAMRGEIDFAESLRRRVALLAGLDAAALQRVYDERLALSPGAEDMLATVKAAGLKTLLVSGGFTFFTERLQARLGFDFSHANELEIIGGKLTDRIKGEIVDAAEKKNAVARACASVGADLAQAIVIGDGANDLLMMEHAGLSVAFRAKPVVRAKATAAFNFIGLDGLRALFL